MTILPKLIYESTLIHVKISAAFFVVAKMGKLILKFIQKFKRPRIAKTVMKNSKVWGFALFNFNTSLTTKTMWYWHKDRNIGQWNKTECLETNPFIYDQSVLTNVPEPFNGRRNSHFNKRSWDGWLSTCGRMTLDHLLHTTYKN